MNFQSNVIMTEPQKLCFVEFGILWPKSTKEKCQIEETVGNSLNIILTSVRKSTKTTDLINTHIKTEGYEHTSYNTSHAGIQTSAEQTYEATAQPVL